MEVVRFPFVFVSAEKHLFIHKCVEKVFTYKGDIKNSSFSFVLYLCEEASTPMIKFFSLGLRQK